MRALLIALALLLLTAGPAAAAPRFVTETDVDPPWTGCAFASGAMWLEATHGRRVSWWRIAARAASPDNGATIGEIAEALGDVLERRVRYSPGGGGDLTWRGLVGRLRAGAGVVLFGAYGEIGEPYIRWDRRFAARADNGHAVYLDRLSDDGTRVYLMDPIGRGRYDGEWVPLRRLAAFAWRHPDGLLFAIAAPAPAEPVVEAAAPSLSLGPAAPVSLTAERYLFDHHLLRGGLRGVAPISDGVWIHPDTIGPLDPPRSTSVYPETIAPPQSAHAEAESAYTLSAVMALRHRDPQ